MRSRRFNPGGADHCVSSLYSTRSSSRDRRQGKEWRKLPRAVASAIYVGEEEVGDAVDGRFSMTSISVERCVAERAMSG